ncbi:MAG: RNA polymerase sigma factor [Candidatus Tectomicrobia bacterium]|uniref:RNA polymerase sigma factor n=1 Tax=Tectimicrobiota bacterium TaxID=2528274 RepID=A0A932M034_UNCTE|nr:RNA polymerase sigma factor [Candidatus Tectomicrobia bacterium]
MSDDQKLMARVKEGEETALELLFAKWEGPLFAFFYRKGCPPSWIEDLTEEVLVSLYRRRNRYDTNRPFAPWIFGIARLVWNDHLRHSKRGGHRIESLEAARNAQSSDPGPARVVEAREKTDMIRRAIEQMPEDQKEAFILRHYHGLSYEEIAQALEAPLGTVKWRIHEAMRRLESLLARWRRNRG